MSMRLTSTEAAGTPTNFTLSECWPNGRPYWPRFSQGVWKKGPPALLLGTSARRYLICVSNNRAVIGGTQANVNASIVIEQLR